jgi:transposase
MGQRETTLRLEIIDCLVRGMSRQEIAKELDCSTRTVDRAKNDPELKQQYYERCNEAINDLIPIALKRLRKLLESDKTQATAQVAAVREVLDRSCLKELLNNTENNDIKVVISYE